MIKSRLSILCALTMSVAGAAPAVASTTWTIDGKEFDVDTLFHAQTGPGITETHLKLTGPRVECVYITEMDATNEYNHMHGSIGDNKGVSAKWLSQMCEDDSKEGRKLIAGVNANFFGPGPLGHVVADGVPLMAASDSYWSFYFGDNKTAGISKIKLNGKMTCGDLTGTLNAINSTILGGWTVIQTDLMGSKVTKGPFNYNIPVRLLEGELNFHGSAKLEVLDQSSTTALDLSADQYALIAPDKNNMINKLKKGDIIDVEFTNDGLDSNIRALGSGLPVLVENGQVLPTEDFGSAYSHLFSRRPRTCAGYSQDGKRAFLVVIDGDNANHSAGATSYEAGFIMKNIGCDKAMNFDGGTSSMLYNRYFGISNIPGNGGRAVSNGMWMVSTAPEDDNVADIKFKKFGHYEIPVYASITPELFAYNQYGDLVDIAYEDYTLSCPEELGTISEDGKTFFANTEGSGILTATSGNLTATIPVICGGEVVPEILVEKMTIDNLNWTNVPLGADVDGTTVSVLGKALTWGVDDPSILSINAEGQIHGIKDGTTTITGSYGDYSASVEVTVQSPTAKEMPLTLNATDWTLTKGGMNSSSVSDDNGAVKINFNIKNSNSAYVTIKNDMEIYSRPDSLQIVVTAAAGKIKTATVVFTDNQKRGLSYNEDYESSPETVVINVPVAQTVGTDPVATANAYPLTLNSIRFDVNGNKNSNGVIRVRSIKAIYDNYGQVSVDNVVIDSEAPVEYYNLQGIRVNNPSAGIYIRKQGNKTSKIIIK